MSFKAILLSGIQVSTENYNFDSISKWIQQRTVLDATGSLLESISIDKRKKRVILAIIVMAFDDEIFSSNSHDVQMKKVAADFLLQITEYLKGESQNTDFINYSIEEYEKWLHTDRQLLLQFEMNASP